MKIFQSLEKTIDCWFLIATAFFFFLLRLPSLFEPLWYGDEGIYQVLGMGINAGRLLYREIWDNKPPLLYLIYSLFSSDQFMVRFASLVFGTLAIFAIYMLLRKIYKEKRVVLFATWLFALIFGLPIIEGNIANAENFMLFPIILAGLLVYNTHYTLYPKRYTLFAAGFLLGLAFLIKVVALFDFAAFFLYLIFIYIDKKRQRKIAIKNLLLFSGAFAVPIATTFLFFATKGALADLIEAVFRQNVGYVGYGNTLLIPQGFLILKLLMLSIGAFFIFTKRNVLGNKLIFIFLWFGFSLFNAFFSQRPYTHYLLVLLPSFVIASGLLFEKQYRKITLFILIITLFIVGTSFTFFEKTAGYYQNYLSFVFFKKDVSEYQKFFDPTTPRDYAITAFLKMRLEKKDQIFVWGNSAQIYTLLGKLPPGRYTVAYHITSSDKSIKETQKILSKTRPRYVVFLGTLPVPLHFVGYTQAITLYNSTIYERVF